MIHLEFEYQSFPLSQSDIIGFQCYSSDPYRLVIFTKKQVFFYDLEGATLLETFMFNHPEGLKIAYPKQHDFFYLIQEGNSKIFRYDKTSLKCLEKLKTHKSAHLADIDLSKDEKALVSCDLKRNIYIQDIETGADLYYHKLSNRRPIHPLRSINFLSKDKGIGIISSGDGAETIFFEPRNNHLEPFVSNSSSSLGGEGMWQNVYHGNHSKASHIYIMEDNGSSKSWLYGKDFARQMREIPIPLKLSPDGHFLLGLNDNKTDLQLCYVPSNPDGSLSVEPLPFHHNKFPDKDLADWQKQLQFSPDSQSIYYLEASDNGEWFLHVWLINP